MENTVKSKYNSYSQPKDVPFLLKRFFSSELKCTVLSGQEASACSLPSFLDAYKKAWFVWYSSPARNRTYIAGPVDAVFLVFLFFFNEIC